MDKATIFHPRATLCTIRVGGDENSNSLDRAKQVPDIPEFGFIHRYVAARNNYGDLITKLELKKPNNNGFQTVIST